MKTPFNPKDYVPSLKLKAAAIKMVITSSEITFFFFFFFRSLLSNILCYFLKGERLTFFAFVFVRLIYFLLGFYEETENLRRFVKRKKVPKDKWLTWKFVQILAHSTHNAKKKHSNKQSNTNKRHLEYTFTHKICENCYIPCKSNYTRTHEYWINRRNKIYNQRTADKE